MGKHVQKIVHYLMVLLFLCGKILFLSAKKNCPQNINELFTSDALFQIFHNQSHFFVRLHFALDFIAGMYNGGVVFPEKPPDVEYGHVHNLPA